MTGSCGHRLNQSIIWELADGTADTCAVFEQVHAEAMRDLADSLERDRNRPD